MACNRELIILNSDWYDRHQHHRSEFISPLRCTNSRSSSTRLYLQILCINPHQFLYIQIVFIFHLFLWAVIDIVYDFSQTNNGYLHLKLSNLVRGVAMSGVHVSVYITNWTVCSNPPNPLFFLLYLLYVSFLTSWIGRRHMDGCSIWRAIQWLLLTECSDQVPPPIEADVWLPDPVRYHQPPPFYHRLRIRSVWCTTNYYSISYLDMTIMIWYDMIEGTINMV